MDENIYAAPHADLIEEKVTRNALASRWARLGASILDTVILNLLIVPFIYFYSEFESIVDGNQLSSTFTLMVSSLGIVLFFLINGYFLHRDGQTIGKKALGIKIVKLDGRKASFMELLTKRYSVYLLPRNIPIVGGLFAIINILFIFGKQRRCIHDYAADTKVVDCNIELKDGQQEPSVSHPSLVSISDVEYEVTDDVNENIRRFKEAQRKKFEQGVKK